MYWIARTTAVVTMIALVFHCSLPSLAATGATIEGTVQIPCDPSRVSEVASVQIRPISGGTAVTLAVDSSAGTFLGSDLAEGDYELIAIGADGKSMSPEPKRLLLQNGVNKVILSMQPLGCGEQDSDRDRVSDETKPGAKDGLKDWHFTLIYVGVVGAIVIALDDDDETTASPSQPR